MELAKGSPRYSLLQNILQRSWTIFLAAFGAGADTISQWNSGIVARPVPQTVPEIPLASPASRTSLASVLPTKSPSNPEPNPQPGATVISHVVASGDTIWALANQYGVTVDTILWANSIPDPSRLRVGQTLKFPSVPGVIHTVGKGESVWSIAKKYGVSGEEIVRTNALANPDYLQYQQSLIIPGARPQDARGTALASRGAQPSRSSSGISFSWPARARISSYYGWRWGRMHSGIDIAVSTGTPVRAAADGRVSYAGWLGDYGKLVIVDHGYGFQTYYAHNSTITVSPGEWVSAGERIALSGNTGRSTGPHVHFEIRRDGRAVDPMNYLR
jgi:murein DD-endopeptidase MepM/ murein hydrolase activator NlpD